MNTLEYQLVGHETFGQAESISRWCRQFYTVAVKSVERAGYGTVDVRDVVADPLQRLAIHDWLVSADPAVADAPSVTPPDGALGNLKLCPGGGRLWNSSSVADSYTEQLVTVFAELFLPNLLTDTTSNGYLVDPSPDLSVLFEAAVQEILQYSPDLAMSVLPHMKLVCWASVGTVDARMVSGSTRRIPGVVFLSVDSLTDTASVAEALIHEAAHLKLFDLYLTLDLLSTDYDALAVRPAERVQVPWNPRHTLQAPDWPPDQALAALHTYLHLGAHGVNRASATGETADPLVRRAAERALFLAEALTERDNRTFLDSTGNDFLAWSSQLAKELMTLAKNPPCEESNDLVRSEIFTVAGAESFYYWWDAPVNGASRF